MAKKNASSVKATEAKPSANGASKADDTPETVTPEHFDVTIEMSGGRVRLTITSGEAHPTLAAGEPQYMRTIRGADLATACAMVDEALAEVCDQTDDE